jgi:pimeloyl-ACP methyl ester carboxylesterase
MMCDARLFQPQIAAFSGEMPIMAMPLIGENTIEGLAQSILRNAPPRFALAGLSMGGIVAMEIVRQAPDRVTRLALLDTNPKAETPEASAKREPQKQAARDGRLRAVMVDEMKPNYLVDDPNKPVILQLCMDMADDLGPDVFIAQSEALASRPDQQDTLRSVTVPTLVLCGRDDIPCPLDRHELMYDLVPNAHLAIIDGAGHLPTLEQPERTNKALRQWMM